MTKISSCTALAGAGVDQANDLLPIVDMSETGAARNKKITATEFLGLAGGAWALAGTGQTATGVYDFAVDGAKADIDFVGLAAFTEVMIIARGLVAANSGQRMVQVSVDNGAAYDATAANYKTVSTTGVEASTGLSPGGIAYHNTASTSARTLVANIINLRGAAKLCKFQGSDTHILYVGSSSDINAIRVKNSAAGNITAGTVHIYAR